MKNIKNYENEYISDYGFESIMVHYRQQLVLEFLVRNKPRTIVEIGCGNSLVSEQYYGLGGDWDKWIIVEPADKFFELAVLKNLPKTTVIKGFFEKIASKIEIFPEVIICSGLLHEVPDANKLCCSITATMNKSTVLHVNVPNSNSLHRLLAKSMGLIDELTELSERNHRLVQPRVFDLKSLSNLLADNGLRAINEGGHFVKPFTHKQMEKMAPILGQKIMSGLYELGKNQPEIASEIFIDLVKK
jgi:hypothetical protein